MKRIILILTLGAAFLGSIQSCQPKQDTIDDKGAVKGDTLDSRQGKGEGEVGEGVYGR